MAKKSKPTKKTNAEIPNSVDQLLDYCTTKYGAGSVMKGRNAIVDVDAFPTGIITIDRAFGCGGVPLGRIMELYGTESSGKTTTCLQFIAACQKHFFKKKDRQGIAAFIDAEHALDPEWASKIGVDMDNLLISQPDSGEDALNIVETMIKSGKVDLVVVDSVAALVPRKELEGEIGDHHVGAQARMMSQGLRKLKGVASNTQSTVVFINQVREKVGIVFGNPETTPGGRALKYYATVRAEISRKGVIKDGDESVGITTKIKMVKNKAAAPFVTGEYQICFGKPARPVFGIDATSSLVSVAEELKIIQRRGSSYRFGDQVLGNGISKTLEFLQKNKEVFNTIQQQTYDRIFHFVDESVEPSRDVDDILNELDDDSVDGGFDEED